MTTMWWLGPVVGAAVLAIGALGMAYGRSSFAETAKRLRLHRRRWETTWAFDARVISALDERSEASTAFIEKAARLGNYRSTSARGGYYYLDPNEPEAKRLAEARLGDERWN